jgi:amino acid transporter
VLYGLGVSIGAGIYVLVGLAAGRSGLNAPFAFMISAGLLLFSAASFAELGTRMPVAASEAAYVDAGFKRDWLTLVTGLLVIVTASISAAAISVGSAGYISVFVNMPMPVLITGVILSMGLIACLSTVQSVTFAGVMTMIEVGGLLLIIGAGLFSGAEIFTRLPEALPAFSMSDWSGIAATALIAVFAFIGFEHLVNVSEEMKDPSRTLPRALFLTLGITAVLYALIVWIAVTAVPPAELAQSSAPLALVFERLTGLPLGTVGSIAVIATLNGIIVHMIMIARVAYGLANAGRIPGFLARINPTTRTPIIATLFGVVAILVLALLVPLGGLADLTSLATLAIFIAVNWALIRIKRNETKPPDDIFLCPVWVPYAGLTASVLLFVVSFLPYAK